MADPSFDVVSKVDRQEVDNALNQAAKELSTRFDFRGTGAKATWTGDEAITIEAETEERCTELAGTFDGKKTAILEKARETKQEATEMMSTYLGDDADALDGFEFLTMAEAGEVGHWSVLEAMSGSGDHPDVANLVKWALPIQQRHLEGVLAASVELAADEDPDEPA